MFKELKVIKLIVIALLLLALIWRIDFKLLSISELYTDKLAYYPGETIKIYTSTTSIIPLEFDLEIKGLTNDFSTKLPLKLTNQKKEHQDVLKNGLGFTDYIEFTIPNDLQSGIYSINKTHPLVVRSRQKSEVTVVYPAMNNLLYATVDGHNVFSDGIPTTSIQRSVFIDKYSQGIVSFFKKSNEKITMNFISDLDLEDKNKFNLSKVLVIYGKSTTWTPEMKENVVDFEENGGHVLNITSNFSNNICWHLQPDKIQLMDNTRVFQSWECFDASIPLSIAGAMYRYSGYSNDKRYRIVDKNHPIFQGIASDEIAIDGKVFQAPPVIQKGQHVEVDMEKCQGYHEEVLALSEASYKGAKGKKGIFVFQRSPLSGKVVVLGTEDWCAANNIGDSEMLQKITQNAIDYLMDDMN